MRYLSVGALASLILWIVIIAIIIAIYFLCRLVFPTKEIIDTTVESLNIVTRTVKIL